MDKLPLSELAKLAALVLWADGSVRGVEIKAAGSFFTKYGYTWEEVEPVILVELSSLGNPENPINDNGLTALHYHFNLGQSACQVICDLVKLCISDGDIAYKEIEIIHQLATIVDVDSAIVTAAFLVELKNNPGLQLDRDCQND